MGKFKTKYDLTGKKFGSLTVIKEGEKHPKRKYWFCKCECGNTKEVDSWALRKGFAKTCGCHKVANEEMIGNKYGKLTVLKQINDLDKSKYFLCRCDCGNEKEVTKGNLIHGLVKSCGCLLGKHLDEYRVNGANYKHGLTNSKIYNIWSGMKRRTTDPKQENYKNYGGRGITVCDEWLDDFQSFYDWSMNNGYKEGLSIERVDTNGNYDPSNCRWIEPIDQYYNKRNTVLVEIDGIKKTYKEWTEQLGVNRWWIESRVRKGLYKKHYLYPKKHSK